MDRMDLDFGFFAYLIDWFGLSRSSDAGETGSSIVVTTTIGG